MEVLNKNKMAKKKKQIEPNPIENLDYNPILKGLLIKYIVFMYESGIEPTEEEIWQEYQLLLSENLLNRLFVQEYLENSSLI